VPGVKHRQGRLVLSVALAETVGSTARSATDSCHVLLSALCCLLPSLLLCATYCLLFAVSYLLPTICYILSAAFCLLHALLPPMSCFFSPVFSSRSPPTCCQLPTVCSLQSAVSCLLSDACCLLSPVSSLLSHGRLLHRRPPLVQEAHTTGRPLRLQQSGDLGRCYTVVALLLHSCYNVVTERVADLWLVSAIHPPLPVPREVPVMLPDAPAAHFSGPAAVYTVRHASCTGECWYTFSMGLSFE
jgi:hypothetical protein